MNRQDGKILLGGDDPNGIAELSAKLQVEMFKVIPVVEREKIVPLARSEVPDIIVLDLQTCFDICRILKRNFVTEPIPIIALLFQAEEADRIAVFELGADDCMNKPVSFRELTLRIRASLTRARDKEGKARYMQAQHYSALTQSVYPSKSQKRG